MGLDTSARIIVGVKLDYEKKTERVKCFHEKTGRPFYRNIFRHIWSVNGIELPGCREVSEEEAEAWEDWEDLCHYCDSENYDSYFIGIEVGQTGDVRDSANLWEEIDADKLADWEIEAEEKIKKAIDVDVTAKVYLLQYVSY